MKTKDSAVIRYLLISFPLILSQLIYSSSGFITTVMISDYGKDALAATVLVNMLWFSLSVIFFGILQATTISVSQAYGAKDHARISEIFSHSLLLGFAMIGIILLIFYFAPFILQHSHQPAGIITIALKYLHGMVYWIPPLVLLVVIENVLVGLGYTQIVLWTSVLLVPLEIGLIYGLMHGYGHFPLLGITGAGVGLGIADAIVILALVCLFRYHPILSQYRWIPRGGYQRRRLIALIQLGTPIGVMSLIEVGSFAIATYCIASFSTTELAAHQITFQYLGLFITVVFSLSQATTVQIGHAVGARKLGALISAALTGPAVGLVIVTGLSYLLATHSLWLVQLDLNETSGHDTLLLQTLKTLFQITAVLLIFDNFRIIGFGILRGIKDTTYPMISSLIGFVCVGLPVGALLGYGLHYGAAGIWVGMTLGIACGALLNLQQATRKLKKIKRGQISWAAISDN
jgi:MATE family multidrug resistance protein